MRSTNSTFLAYGKSIVAAIAMVTGTAVMMSTFPTTEAPLKDYRQSNLAGNTSPLVNISDIENDSGKPYRQMPGASGTSYVRVSDPL